MSLTGTAAELNSEQGHGSGGRDRETMGSARCGSPLISVAPPMGEGLTAVPAAYHRVEAVGLPANNRRHSSRTPHTSDLAATA